MRRAGELGGFAVVWGYLQVRQVLCFCQDVFKALKCVFRIFGHVHVDGSVLVFPSQVDAAELFSFPVNGNGVFALQCLD